jgi:RNA-directed DNA polymerase
MTLESILSYKNLEEALQKVESNKGVGGVDGMQTDELRDYLHTHYTELRNTILKGEYKPQAVKKVEIPKPTGGKRMLGIPTVLDRLLQQAIHQLLHQTYELGFSESSYGFRPQRNTHQAVYQAQKLIQSGNTYIIELDLEKFFDRVNHDRLMSKLREKVKDERVLSLIFKFLRSGIMEGGIVSQRTEGTPQGSPLSPLLSNIILDELDKELETRGHYFVRYADDCSIYVKSKKTSERVMGSIIRYIEGRLLLKVNKEKSKVSRPSKSKLLGFSFYKTGIKWEIRIGKEPIKRLKEKLKVLSSRNNGKNTATKIQELSPIILGWVSYFRIARAQTIMEKLDEMLRTRLRMSLWKEWKTIKGRIRNLQKLGISKSKSYQWGNTSKGYCRTAHSPILTRSLDKEYFRKNGLLSFKEIYQKKTELPLKFT